MGVWVWVCVRVWVCGCVGGCVGGCGGVWVCWGDERGADVDDKFAFDKIVCFDVGCFSLIVKCTRQGLT